MKVDELANIAKLSRVKSAAKRFLVGPAIVVVLLVAAVAQFIYAKPGSFPLPNPNGYDDFLKAGALVSSEVNNFVELDRDGLRQLVSTNAESLRLLRLGLTRTCSVPTAALLTNFTTTTDLPALKRLAQLLAGEGRLAELEGRTNDAAKIYLKGMRYANETCHGGFLIHRMVGIACEAIAVSRLADIVPSLNCDQARPLIAQLAELDGKVVSWAEVGRLERVFMRAQIRKYPNPLVGIAEWWQTRSVIASVEGKHNLIIARHRLLLVELALRCYRAEVGQPPSKLENLVPKYVAQLPEDPFTRKPFTYRPSGTNWLLYSIGPDKTDDGGKSVQRRSTESGGTGDLFFDSPF